MKIKARHYCRKCRVKLPEPVENQHHAFCKKGCFEQFYHKRCLACEKSLRTARRSFCPKPAKCANLVRTWPKKYRWPGYCRGSLGSAHSTGIKIGLRGHPSSLYCLRGWWWGDPVDGDLSLYDKDGLALARLVLEGGRYHLRHPLTWPRMSWPNLEQAKRGAESFALCSLPLDPNRAARIKRDDTTPHPLGPPLNRPLLVTMPVVEAPPIAPDFEAEPLDIPEFLRRAS
jgi:hypothetical protein